MKDAFVTVDHLGDNGTVTTGMILKDVVQKRFDALKKNGLVREATAEEVKEGYKPPFTPEGGDKAAEPPKNKQASAPLNKAAS